MMSPYKLQLLIKSYNWSVVCCLATRCDVANGPEFQIDRQSDLLDASAQISPRHSALSPQTGIL